MSAVPKPPRHSREGGNPVLSKPLGEICNVLAGYGFPERLQGKHSGDFPFFKVGDISEAWKRGDRLLTTANHYLNLDEAESIRAKPFPPETVVFAKIGAAIALNRRAILTAPSLVDNNVMGLSPATSELDARYLFHFMCTIQLDKLARATTVPSIRKGDVGQIEIPVPPLAEQRRIVAELETQLTRLDASVTALKRVQANLKRYRASVLKAACEGRLVPTEAFLVAPLGDLIGDISQGWSPKCDLMREPNFGEWAVIKTTAVQSMKYMDVECKPLPESFVPRPHIEIRPGDFLMTRKGPRERAGVTCFVRQTRQHSMVCDTVYRFRCHEDRVAPDYLEIALNSLPVVHAIDKLKSGISDSGVSLTHQKVCGVQIPLPNLHDQKRIVAEVERRLSVIEELEATVAANLKRAERLRQATLARSFSVRED